jgi:hypothetical protein
VGLQLSPPPPLPPPLPPRSHHRHHRHLYTYSCTPLCPPSPPHGPLFPSSDELQIVPSGGELAVVCVAAGLGRRAAIGPPVCWVGPGGTHHSGISPSPHHILWSSGSGLSARLVLSGSVVQGGWRSSLSLRAVGRRCRYCPSGGLGWGRRRSSRERNGLRPPFRLRCLCLPACRHGDGVAEVFFFVHPFLHLLSFYRHSCPSLRISSFVLVQGWDSGFGWGRGGDTVPASETGCDYSLPFRLRCLRRASRRGL